MKRRLVVISLVAILVLLANSASGQEKNQVPAPLPQFLPIGSDQRMCDWAVTNRPCAVAFDLTYKNTNGTDSTVGISGTNLRFTSYASFMQCLVTNSMNLFATIKNKTNLDTRYTIQFSSLILYFDIGGYPGLAIDTNIGLVSQITSNTFGSVIPDFIGSIIDVHNLQKVLLVVPSSTTYSNQWTPTTGWSTNKPAGYTSELATTEIVAFNRWYGNGSYPETRITLTADGKTMTYTACGEPILPPTLGVDRNMQVSITMPRGSDTTVEASVNLVDWQPIATFYGTSNVSSAHIVTDPKIYNKRFYRAFAR